MPACDWKEVVEANELLFCAVVLFSLVVSLAR